MYGLNSSIVTSVAGSLGDDVAIGTFSFRLNRPEFESGVLKIVGVVRCLRLMASILKKELALLTKFAFDI